MTTLALSHAYSAISRGMRKKRDLVHTLAGDGRICRVDTAFGGLGSVLGKDWQRKTDTGYTSPFLLGCDRFMDLHVCYTVGYG
jgi:hypothetical protein